MTYNGKHRARWRDHYLFWPIVAGITAYVLMFTEFVIIMILSAKVSP